MIEYLHKLLAGQGLAPHGFCLLWDPALIWTHVITDALIAAAYFSIPVAMGYFLLKRPDVRFGWVAWLFAVFILACGATHVMGMWVLWYPDYGPQALVKIVTAVASVVTAIALWPLLPKAIALPSPLQLETANADLRLRVDERDAALVALGRETAERERTEDMLRQSQKMEAVGQLTGGIAHDFNNLMTIIVANLDRALRLPPGDPRTTTTLENALTGARRAATLTDQLLAFSRKQPLDPGVHDLNDLVARTADLFAATLDAGIAVQTELPPGVWPVRVDANQTENALLNLAVNARDAMPDGGTVTIRTLNIAAGTRDDAPPGDQVMIEVADTGTGMSPETIARAFEPFFTTKGVGQGTGLGLAQVYGFINQSGGRIAIHSVEGEGTTLRIFLPRALGPT
ncbi:ATP-binding protein [Glacieibacterium frigidum]|nr:ATP-binding protein [Glacieibacterium frigidum]